MSAAVVFLLFFVCLIIAIPISIALGIVSVLPGAFDPSFTASGQFVIRSMLGGIDSFPLLAVPMFVLSGMIMAKGPLPHLPADLPETLPSSHQAVIPVRMDHKSHDLPVWNIPDSPGFPR